MRISITILILLSAMMSMHGQQTYKEIKSISKTYDIQPGNKIIINGERTFINIETWNRKEVNAEIEVISKYENQEQAKKDLEKIKVLFDKKGDNIYYSNAIQLNNATDKPKSNLRTELNLIVPEYAIIEIENVFGELEITGKINSIISKSKFCTNTTKNFEGKLEINSEYDKNTIEDSKGEIRFVGKRSDLSLTKLNAKVKADMNYGKLDITYSKSRVDFAINTKHTPITMLVLDDDSTYHNMTCNNCNIDTDNYSNIGSGAKSKKKHVVTIGTETSGQSISIINSELEDIKVISINAKNN